MEKGEVNCMACLAVRHRYFSSYSNVSIRRDPATGVTHERRWLRGNFFSGWYKTCELDVPGAEAFEP